MNRAINILEVINLGDFKLKLVFDDQKQQTIDFGPFLAQSKHPDIRAWLDRAKFEQYRLCDGELVWGDYELCFPLIDLYQNNIDHFHPVSAAA